MATPVPNQTGFTVGLQGGQGARLAPSVPQDQGGRQLSALGASVADLGGQLASIQAQAAERANNARVADALNTMKEKALDLSYGAQDGFTNVKGGDVLTRPNGGSFVSEWQGKLSDSASAVTAGLANDEQRRLFSQGMAQIQASYNSGLLQHFNQETRTFELSTYSGGIETAQRESALSGGDPRVVASTSERIRALTHQSFALLGKSGVEADEQARKFISEGHVLTMARMLENNQPAQATEFFNRIKDQLEPEAYVRGEAQLRDINRQTDVTNFVTGLMSSNGPGGAATSFDNLVSAVLGAEGGGTLENPKTSPKGAKGPMQVMDATNLDPGYGVAPAKDNSQAERARVGRELLGAFVKKYGTRLGVAAYNGGPGRLEAAIEKAKAAGPGADPVSFMPAETRAYVQTVMSKVDGQTPGDPRASLTSLLNAARQRYINDPKAMAEAERQITSMYGAAEADKNRNEQDAVDGAMRSIWNNGGVVTPQIAQAVPGKYLDNLNSFANQVRNRSLNVVPEDVSTARAARIREDMIFGRITSQDQLLHTVVGAGINTRDYQALAGDLASIQSGNQKSIDKYTTLRNTLQFLHGEMANAGLDWTPDAKDPTKADAYAQFSAKLFAQISTMEQIRGKALEPDEARKVALQLLGEVPGTKSWFFGSNKRGYELTNPNLPLSAIPTDVRQQIENQLRAARLPVTENNIRTTLARLASRRN